MSHASSHVSSVEDACESLSLGISRVDDASNVGKANEVALSPFLDSEVLDVHVSSTRGRSVVIDDVDSGLIVHMEHGRFGFIIAKVREDHTYTEHHLSCKDDGKEFSFGTGGGNGRL